MNIATGQLGWMTCNPLSDNDTFTRDPSHDRPTLRDFVALEPLLHVTLKLRRLTGVGQAQPREEDRTCYSPTVQPAETDRP